MNTFQSMTEDQKRKYGEALRQGARRISECQSILMEKAAEMLGAALGRGVGAVHKWFRGEFIPTNAKDIEALAWVIRKKSDYDKVWFEEFLKLAHYPVGERRKSFLNDLFPLLSLPKEVDEEGDDEDEAHRHFPSGPPIIDPRNFFGHSYELRCIFFGWKQRSFTQVLITGPKRSGKTSLLYYLKNITTASKLRPGQKRNWLPNPERYQWVFIDFQENHLRTKEGLFCHILTSLGLPMPPSCTFLDFRKALQAGSDKYIMLLMDELGAVADAPDLDGPFWSNMRALISAPPQTLGVTVVTPKNFREIARKQGNQVSDFLNIFQEFTLGPLEEIEARELISSSPLPFAPADIDWILQNSKGWPALLSILCRHRLISLLEDDTSTKWQAKALSAIANFRYLLEE